MNDGDFLGQPTKLALVGETLVVTDILPPHLHALARSDGRRLASFGGEGGGPGEFQSATSVQADPRGDGSFWVFDTSQDRMTRYAPVTGAGAPRLLQVMQTPPPSGSVYLRPVLLDDSTLVSTGIYPEGRLIVTRPTGRLVATIGETPAPPPGKDVPVTVLQHAYTGPLERSPDGSRLALATRHADQIELYRADGTLLRKLRGSSGFDPVYEVRRQQGWASMTTGDDLRFGYIDLASTDRYLFALFSGNLWGEMPQRANFGKHVQVFDWEGARVGTFELAERAIGIAVDPAGRELFALQWEPKPAVVRYSLEGRLPGAARTAGVRQP